MIKAYIIDDEHLSRNTLKNILSKTCPNIEVVAEFENTDSAFYHMATNRPDLIFLDIAMPNKNGIDFLSEFEVIDFEVIFVTAHDQYILQAMHLSAVDYLLKPVVGEELKRAVYNAEKRIQSKSTHLNLNTFLQNIKQQVNYDEMQLCIPTIKGFQVVKLIDIIYCEAENTYTYIHLKDNVKILSSRPLVDYDRLLSDTPFIRIHKSSFINMNHIKEYQKGEGGVVVMSNGKSLDVSRRKKEFFITKMKEKFKY